jgi:uncharacterized protein YjcR
VCGEEMVRTSKMCMKCYGKSRRKPRPTVEQLTEDLRSMTKTEAAKKYGVSDSSIRHWSEEYGIGIRKKRVGTSASLQN